MPVCMAAISAFTKPQRSLHSPTGTHPHLGTVRPAQNANSNKPFRVCHYFYYQPLPVLFLRPSKTLDFAVPLPQPTKENVLGFPLTSNAADQPRQVHMVGDAVRMFSSCISMRLTGCILEKPGVNTPRMYWDWITQNTLGGGG